MSVGNIGKVFRCSRGLRVKWEVLYVGKVGGCGAVGEQSVWVKWEGKLVRFWV